MNEICQCVCIDFFLSYNALLLFSGIDNRELYGDPFDHKYFYKSKSTDKINKAFSK